MGGCPCETGRLGCKATALANHCVAFHHLTTRHRFHDKPNSTSSQVMGRIKGTSTISIYCKGGEKFCFAFDVLALNMSPSRESMILVIRAVSVGGGARNAHNIYL